MGKMTFVQAARVTVRDHTMPAAYFVGEASMSGSAIRP